MPKIFESKPADFLDSYTRENITHRALGSPTRFLEVWERRLNQYLMQSLEMMEVQSLGGLNDRALGFAQRVRVKWNFMIPDDLTDDLLTKRIAFGKAMAARKWLDIEALLMDRRVTILEAMLVARNWIDNRNEAMESKHINKHEQSRAASVAKEVARLESLVKKECDRAGWIIDKVKKYEEERIAITERIAEFEKQLESLRDEAAQSRD